jgi:exonuclease III
MIFGMALASASTGTWAARDYPWVNDYIFASESIAKKVVAHQVVEQPEMLALSDHNPVVATFDL